MDDELMYRVMIHARDASGWTVCQMCEDLPLQSMIDLISSPEQQGSGKEVTIIPLDEL